MADGDESGRTENVQDLAGFVRITGPSLRVQAYLCGFLLTWAGSESPPANGEFHHVELVLAEKCVDKGRGVKSTAC